MNASTTSHFRFAMIRRFSFPAIMLAFHLANPLFAQETISFNRDVRPILSNNCYQCHGFDANTRKAELRLDTLEGATQTELESVDGFAVVPGKPAESVLLERITTHDALERMPPAAMGKQITPEQVGVIRKWIEQGAKYEQHWAFIPPKSEKPPAVKQSAWPRNEIDRFILSQLEAKDLSPSPEANRRTLVRRVALDVTGLPPTLDEISTFLKDDSDEAYENMVDRFLASPNYGEHMARYWLDLARYADTSGYQYDKERTMWVWRDWVINAYNQNMPFDQFTIEQLAGDLLPNASPQQILATGFNRNHPITIEGGVIDEEYRTEYVIDRLSTTSTVWMGLTVACARCHDHKFDPISQKDFYQLSAYFNQVAERGLNGFDPQQKIASPLEKPPTPESLAKIAKIKSRIRALTNSESEAFGQWLAEIANSKSSTWTTLDPHSMNSSGKSTLTKQADLSVLVGGANPQKDVYEITASTSASAITAIRLECLTDQSLPGGGPGRHSNSNFVLSEFEVTAISKNDPAERQQIKFSRAMADYSQVNYEIEKAIDGTVANNNGWAVDGPSRKKPATAIFIAETPFGFDGGTELKFRLRHEASFSTHGVGRPRFSLSCDAPKSLEFNSLPKEVLLAAAKPAAERTDAETSALRKRFVIVNEEKIKQFNSELEQLSPLSKYPMTMVMKDRPQPRQTHILIRGQYDLKGEPVSAGVPTALTPLPEGAPLNRLGLAQWLVAPGHPLTARVAVNRHWARIFGTGLVKTVEDFGTQGDWPSHPALLDSLAVEFEETNWDVKNILKKMLMSATYRQSSKISRQLLELDPDNRLLARGPRFRLDAEQIRDQALAVSGLLHDQVGGASVYPYQPDGLWMELNNRPGFSRSYVVDQGESLYRRSLYTFWKRTVLSPMMKTFDAPGREFCTVNRSRSNTPLQALLLLQGPQFVEAARQLAERMMRDGGVNIAEKIEHGFELVTARKPGVEETKILTEFYHDRLGEFSGNPKAANQLLKVGASRRNSQLPPAEHAAWMEVARLLLNLDEVINRD